MLRINNALRHTVAFLTQEGPAGIRPMASAFFVTVGMGDGGYLAHYLVSARHNVEYARAKNKPLHYRINTVAGVYRDIEIGFDEWIPHPTTDVTVAPVNLLVGIIASYIPYGMLLRADQTARTRPQEGAEICMPSLFATFFGKNIMHAVFRTGRLALVPDEKLPANLGPRQEHSEVDGYLVETLSWGGCSGAPVFIDYFDPTAVSKDPWEIGPTRVLGLISGHYNSLAEIDTNQDTNQETKQDTDQDAKKDTNQVTKKDSVKVDINGGLALVIPAQGIVDLLMADDVKENRERNFYNFTHP